MKQLNDSYLTGSIRPRPGKCPLCLTSDNKLLDIGTITLPGFGVEATILHDKRRQVTHAAIGLTCGCYAKFHRQVAHIADNRASRGFAHR